MKRVSGEMRVLFTVELPDAATPVCAADPAAEAAMQAVTQQCSVYLWGEQQDPAIVTAEVDEQDVTIEEDER